MKVDFLGKPPEPVIALASATGRAGPSATRSGLQRDRAPVSAMRPRTKRPGACADLDQATGTAHGSEYIGASLPGCELDQTTLPARDEARTSSAAVNPEFPVLLGALRDYAGRREL